MTTPSLPESISTRQAAKLLHVALSTVQAWVESGHLQAWKTPGGHRRIPLESVHRLLSSGSVKRAVSEFKSSKILVVEDDPDQRELYAAHFANWKLPISIIMVSNGYDGLVQAASVVPDLLLADLGMPEMDGFRMIEALRKSKYTEHLPMIVVTGLSSFEIEQRGGLPPTVTVMFKPVDYVRLKAQVVRCLNESLQRPSPVGISEGASKTSHDEDTS
jgi:excisionase family DNA binding protein